MTIRRLAASESEAGARVDHLLRQRVPEVTRAHLASLFATGSILHNGRRAAKGHTVSAGDVLELSIPSNLGAAPDPATELQLVLETHQLVVVDKPAALPCAPLTPDELGCVANALVYRFPEMAAIGYRPLEPGLIHRLDNDTSGLLVAARSTRAFEDLCGGLRSGKLSKWYLAITRSEPAAGATPLRDGGELTHFIGPDPDHTRRVRTSGIAAPGLRAAACKYRIVHRGPDAQLLELTVSAAYRHQLRAQLAAAGYPLLGDVLYGGPAVRALARHALHASRLGWLGSPNAAKFDVSSPLPPELAKLL